MRILVTAIGSMSAEAVITSLARRPGARVIGCNMYPAEWTPASRLVHRFHQVASAKSEDIYIKQIIALCQSEGISHVIPLTDPEVDVLTSQRGIFDTAGIMLCIPSESAVRIARDKLALYERFAPHPRVQPIITAPLDGDISFKGIWPLLGKPRNGRSSEGLVSIPDPEALKYWRRRLSRHDYIVQPLYTGDVMTVDVCRSRHGENAIAVARQELVRTSNGAGMTIRMQPHHVCEALAVEVANDLELIGCTNIEFLMVDGKCLLMDANPRFSAGVSFSLMAGYDMVANHLRCFENEPLERRTSAGIAVYARGFCDHSLQA